MLGMISVSQSIEQSLIDCKVVDGGIKSDHSTVCMLWENRSFRYSNNSITRGKLNLQELQNDQETNSKFSDIFASKVNNETTYEDTCDFIQEAACARRGKKKKERNQARKRPSQSLLTEYTWHL